jgi:tetratricopeptide (TPR) repeat protein
VLLLIANALYCDSRHKEAMKYLSRALRSHPNDAALWHNCGVVQYSFAQELFDKHRRPGPSAAADITAAGDYAKSAKRIFGVLLPELEANEVNPTEWGGRLRAMGIDSEKVKELVSFCDKAIDQVPERVRVATEVTLQQEQRRQERAEAAEAHARVQAESRAKLEIEQEEAREKAAERARLRQEQLKSLQGFEESTEKKRKKGKKAAEAETMAAQGYGFSSDEDDNIDEAPILRSVTEDSESPQKRPKSEAPPQQYGDGLSDSEDEFDPTPKPTTTSKASLGLDESEDEFDPTPKPTTKSKASLGLDDSEDEDDITTNPPEDEVARTRAVGTPTGRLSDSEDGNAMN